ncbi:MAG: tRNA 2-thiouridine(34) synthase MnmA [Planctomycetota bacterium]|jgi:tRNA-specific 2-thiouridylase
MATEKYNISLMPPSLSAWSPQRDSSRQIAMLMSGGVDSSVAAHLLKEAGWDVLGITMKIPSCDTGVRGCCGADAALVCHEMGLAHYYIDVTLAFEELIIGRFRRTYAKGHTPNPCIDCNTLLKFSLVWDFIEAEFGIAHLATGHYARIHSAGGEMRLGRAKDRAKDQSYFLYGIARERLKDFVLPLGELTKPEVRKIAAKLNLSVAEKAESMELCFAGEGDYRVALSGEQAESCGKMTDMQGNTIGEHKGISNYTLGQRRGIGFAGGKPLYVGRIDAATNTIALGTRQEVSFRTINVEHINVLIPDKLKPGKRLLGKIRSYGDPGPCTIIGANGGGISVEFDEPQFAPSPGQRLVLYDEQDDIVAGGEIASSS